MPAGLTANDSMFSVRETPWHGLGAVLDEYPMGIDDALDKSGLGWAVEQEPILRPSPVGFGAGPIIPGYKANIRSDSGDVLGIVSNDYTVVQNRDAFKFLDSLIGSDLHFETAGSIWDGRRVWVLARLPEFVEVGGDATGTYIYVANSHDGSLAVTAAVTPIRIVCQNTLGLALRGARQSYKFRHVGDLQEKFDEARRVLDLTLDYERQFKILGDRLANVTVSTDTFSREVLRPLLAMDELGLGDRAKKNRSDQHDRIMGIFLGNGPDGDTRGNSPYTAWSAVNAIGEYADWARRRTKRTNQVARSFEDHDLKQKGLDLVTSAVSA